MVQFLTNYRYMADYISDLETIENPRWGAECYVIETGSEFKCNSEGKWFNQNPSSISSNGNNIDLSNYYTKAEVDAKIDEMVALTKEEILAIC